MSLKSEVMADARETSADYRLTALAAERKRAEAEVRAKRAVAERDAAQSEVGALRNKCNGLSSRLAASDRANRGAAAADVRAALAWRARGARVWGDSLMCARRSRCVCGTRWIRVKRHTEEQKAYFRFHGTANG